MIIINSAALEKASGSVGSLVPGKNALRPGKGQRVKKILRRKNYEG
jgi:hypothetical protein